MMVKGHSLTKQEAKRLAVRAGVDFNKDFHQLRGGDVSTLLSIARQQGYRKPVNASGSKGRYYFYYLQKVRG